MVAAAATVIVTVPVTALVLLPVLSLVRTQMDTVVLQQAPAAVPEAVKIGKIRLSSRPELMPPKTN
jgi:hypothetical protein